MKKKQYEILLNFMRDYLKFYLSRDQIYGLNDEDLRDSFFKEFGGYALIGEEVDGRSYSMIKEIGGEEYSGIDHTIYYQQEIKDTGEINCIGIKGDYNSWNGTHFYKVFLCEKKEIENFKYNPIKIINK